MRRRSDVQRIASSPWNLSWHGLGSPVAHFAEGESLALLQVALRLKATSFEHIVVGLDRIRRGDLVIDHSAKKLDEDQRMLREVDLATEQRDARAVLAGIVDGLPPFSPALRLA